MKSIRYDNSIRIDPADQHGIHIVQNDGGEQVYILKTDIPHLIQQLQDVIK